MYKGRFRAPDVPRPVSEQLKTGAVLAIHVAAEGGYLFQMLVRVTKMNARLFEENLGCVAFMTLTGKHGHRT